MTRTQSPLHEHLAKEHRISPWQTYLKEIVYGGNDGIVTTFAVVAGFSGANLASTFPQAPFLTVLIFGLANLFADATSMGLGNFLSLHADQDVFKGEQQRELHEIRTNPEIEKRETVEILVSKGFSNEQAKEITTLYATNESYWLDFMMHHELEMADPTGENPIFTGLTTFTAFLVFGTIPLLPYILFPSELHSFLFSASATAAALILLGLLKWRITREDLFRSVSEIVLIGGTAAAIAYLVGSFFAH